MWSNTAANCEHIVWECMCCGFIAVIGFDAYRQQIVSVCYEGSLKLLIMSVHKEHQSRLI